MVANGMLGEIESMYFQLCQVIPSGDFVLPTSSTTPTTSSSTSVSTVASAPTRDFQWYVAMSAQDIYSQLINDMI
jgi:hypothetical protein